MVPLGQTDGSQPGLKICHIVIIEPLPGFQEEILVVLREMIGTDIELGLGVSMELE